MIVDCMLVVKKMGGRQWMGWAGRGGAQSPAKHQKGCGSPRCCCSTQAAPWVCGEEGAG
jgi:hypothetical protein